MTAGYSGTPLVAKLGIKPGLKVYVDGVAPDLDLGQITTRLPKQACGVQTDLNENVVRDIALAAGVVDVKVIAIDETWSGLKLVRRLKDR